MLAKWRCRIADRPRSAARPPAPSIRRRADERRGGRARVDGVGEVPRRHRRRPRRGTARARSIAIVRPLAVGGGEGLEHPASRPRSSPRCSPSRLAAPALEADRRLLELARPASSLRSRPRARRWCRRPGPSAADRLDQGLGHGARRRPPARGRSTGSGSSRAAAEPGGVGGPEATGVAHHHHPAVDQERRRGAGVDDRPRRRGPRRRAAVLLDHQGGLAVADQPVDEAAGLLGDQGRVVPPDQVDGGGSAAAAARADHRSLIGSPRARRPARRGPGRCRPRRGPGASGSRGRPRGPPRPATPPAARSISRSRRAPRKVLLDAESSSG